MILRGRIGPSIAIIDAETKLASATKGFSIDPEELRTLSRLKVLDRQTRFFASP
jgi:hypothetical protein